MEGEGDVVYRTVPWNRRLLSQHHKKPAGPLFDIKCVQQSVCQLHVPHCEILSTGGFQFLSVAHVTDEGIEFIRPQKITETHVVINITGFSGYGNVKDEDCPPDPVRALVLLFYRPPEDPDPESLINVLLVPRNIVVRDVQRTRRKLIGDEIYIDKPPHCKLQPNQVYTLSTCPQNCSVKIEPPDAEFDEEFHSSYFTTFQVILKTTMKKIMLSLKQKSSSNTVWKREVCLPSTKKGNSCAQCALNPSPNQRLRNIQSPMSTGNRKSSEEKLLDVRSRFVDGISEPVLKCLLDKLLEKKVMNDSERESMNEKQNKRDKARFVIDTVRKKGEAASSEMIDFLCEVDTFLCGHLGLM
ncbi:Caspase recruitment domain-containing protein 8 [Channa argus]|uniref:Caspase recruitment domain-containing protein 8 n=1 Tax=Channa argus TaxID=215402 RepID=A0A6G1QN23_CHAAH|nr:Caspase recruitment domain-containing protein 8 [Channa argus]